MAHVTQLDLLTQAGIPAEQCVIFSPCGTYRYRLERTLRSGAGTAAIIMVNPSVAGETKNDPTVTKILGFARRHGWKRIVVGNLFGLVATDVRQLGRVADPIGPENDRHLKAIFSDCDQVIFAWGPLSKQPRSCRGRAALVALMALQSGHSPLQIGRSTNDGQPRHPLMLAYNEPLKPFAFDCIALPIADD